MKYTPHAFQAAAIDHAVEFAESAQPGQRKLYSAPTGCGKSVVELEVQDRLGEGCYIVSPREEIIAGMIDKGGPAERIFTPITLRNRLRSGALRHPKFLIVDECHHAEAETYQQLDLLSGLVPMVGYTATPYRGSPKSTASLLKAWGDPLQIITLQEAARSGYVSLPRYSTLPLVDDDEVTVSGGEFQVTSLDSVTVDRLGDMAEHCRQWYNGTWDRVTAFAMPSTECCRRIQSELCGRGLPAVIVSAATPREQRQAAFAAVLARVAALLQIQIISEGVDMPIRRLVDMAPTLSPVRWIQQVGRVTRPVGTVCRGCGSPAACPCGKERAKEPPPEVVITNRNLLRHSYAMEGAVPIASIVEAERAFQVPSRRAAVRSLGLEAVGRFAPVPVRLTNGATMHMYALACPTVAGVVVEYCCLVHPCEDPLWAVKVNVVKDGVKTWGKWERCEAPEDLRGFASCAQSPVTEKQGKWWRRSAAYMGLDPEQEVTRKSFQALPVLSDLGVRMS